MSLPLDSPTDGDCCGETLRDEISKGPNLLFVVFSSNPGDSGKPWCGYCVKAEPDTDGVFKNGDARE